jgi:hypothetical protein
MRKFLLGLNSFFIFAVLLFNQNCSRLVSDASPSKENFGVIEKSSSSRLFQNSENDRFWFGPMAFGEDDTSRGWAVPSLRPNYQNTFQLLNPTDFSDGKLNVFKTYIMILPAEVSTDIQLQKLINGITQKNLKVAIEVGGMRTSQFCGVNAGALSAKSELSLLNRWTKLGGRIDYLTTDHSLMSSLATPIRGFGLGNPKCRMSLDQLIDEQINYFVTIRRAYPKVRLGMIESLGFFNFTNPSVNFVAQNKIYRVTDTTLPGWDLGEILEKLAAKGSANDIKLDHFHIDYSFEGVEFDGQTHGGLRIEKRDYGRIELVNQLLKKHGINSGIIVNANGLSDSLAAARTIQFLKELMTMNNLDFNHVIFQTWFNFPSRVGHYLQANTGLGLISSLTNVLKANDDFLPEGLFVLGPAVYYANFEKQYCQYSDWEKFKKATGLKSIQGIRTITKIPNSMINHGFCVIP